MIYHYCNQSVFEKIIQTKEIWISDITKMNDESEYKSGYQIILEVLNENNLSAHDFSNEMSDKNLNNTFQILIGCFSSNGDLKSQWAEYAENGTGVSIGFNQANIEMFNMFNRYFENKFQPISSKVKFIRVNYDEKLLRSTAQAIIERYASSQSLLKWPLLSRALMYLSISYKNSFFCEEDETRAVVTLESSIDDKYKIEQRETKYGNANFHRLKTSFQQFQSIEEVVIGPKSTMTVDSVTSMLDDAGITNVLVKQSVATGRYR